MEFTPIPELDGYFMSDSVAVWHELRGKKVYIRPYHRKSGREFYVKVWKDGYRRTVAVKALAWRTYGGPEVILPENLKRLPDYPAYRFSMDNGRLRAFKERKEIFASNYPNSKHPRLTLTDYNGKRSTVCENKLKEMFANAF